MDKDLEVQPQQDRERSNVAHHSPQTILNPQLLGGRCAWALLGDDHLLQRIHEQVRSPKPIVVGVTVENALYKIGDRTGLPLDRLTP
jgi:hypothetical protein